MSSELGLESVVKRNCFHQSGIELLNPQMTLLSKSWHKNKPFRWQERRLGAVKQQQSFDLLLYLSRFDDQYYAFWIKFFIASTKTLLIKLYVICLAQSTTILFVWKSTIVGLSSKRNATHFFGLCYINLSDRYHSYLLEKNFKSITNNLYLCIRF